MNAMGMFLLQDAQSPQSPAPSQNNRWVYLIQVASEKASELDALAAMSRRKKRKAMERMTAEGGAAVRSSRALFGREDTELMALIMQRYELLLGVEPDWTVSSRRPRRFVGSVVRRLLDEPPGRSRFKSIDRARVFECQQLPAGRPLEHTQEFLVETTWDHETGLPDSCERLTGRGWLGRSATHPQLEMSCLLAQPQRPVDGGEFHFQLSPDDDDIVAYWCKSRSGQYMEEWTEDPEPKPERKVSQPSWPMCGVISQRGLPCPQRKDSCPYHRRGNSTKPHAPTPPVSPRVEKVNGKRDVCGVMSQRGLRCSQKKGACPYHSNLKPGGGPNPGPKPRTDNDDPDQDPLEGDPSRSHSSSKGEAPGAPAEQLQEEHKEQQQEESPPEAASPEEKSSAVEPSTNGAGPSSAKKQGTQMELVTAACNFMVTVTEVDEHGACLLGWSYPPGCARDAGALLALSVAEHWRTAKLPSPLSTKMWREELAGGARKYIAENTGMGMCTFSSSSLARVSDGQYVFVLVDSSGSARAISQQIDIKENKVISLSGGACRMSHFNQMDSQRRRSRPEPVQTKPAPPPPAMSPRVKKVPVVPQKRTIKDCPSGDAESLGSRARKSHHSEWTLLGARFTKEFGGYGDFEGVVLRDDGDLGFLVKYANDSDMEHIDAGELLDLIHRFRSATTTPRA
eukprot:TRINITY_DN1054_c0_g1_i2.p1 TRINITY_DN1054_c0_g1~~TRINITY_DN1054_c0_g1_i2.p1  ORF type:complete len:681 (+),score=123.42 TRINITY_DN1054_c0_g1_i2:405-2447(+)